MLLVVDGMVLVSYTVKAFIYYLGSEYSQILGPFKVRLHDIVS